MFYNYQMDTKTFYGARPRTLLALVRENPQESDGDLSDDDDQVEDPDYQPTQADGTLSEKKVQLRCTFVL